MKRIMILWNCDIDEDPPPCEDEGNEICEECPNGHPAVFLEHDDLVGCLVPVREERL